MIKLSCVVGLQIRLLQFTMTWSLKLSLWWVRTADCVASYEKLFLTHQLLRSIYFNSLKARKTESSLQRLRQGAQRRVGASTDASDSIISDTDKICMQLFLDIQVCCLPLVQFCSCAHKWYWCYVLAIRNSPSRFISHLNQNNVVLLDLFGTQASIFFRLGLTTYVAINKHKVDLDMIFWYCIIFAGVRTKPSCDRNRRERDWFLQSSMAVCCPKGQAREHPVLM